jgi:hypothetical protein
MPIGSPNKFAIANLSKEKHFAVVFRTAENDGKMAKAILFTSPT